MTMHGKPNLEAIRQYILNDHGLPYSHRRGAARLMERLLQNESDRDYDVSLASTARYQATDNSRRGIATYAIYKALVAAGAKPTTTMPSAMRALRIGDRDEYKSVVMKAAAFESQTALEDVFGYFKTHTRDFLRTHKVLTSGGDPNNEAKFSIYSTVNATNRESFIFFYSVADDRFRIMGGGNTMHVRGAKTKRVSVVCVPALLWSDVPLPGGAAQQPQQPDFSSIRGCKLVGADIMVTTQFSGCSFCWAEANGSIYAAHIGPGLEGQAFPGGGAALATTLISNGSIVHTNNAPLQVFGRDAGNGGTATPQHYSSAVAVPTYIIGINRAGGAQDWRFYEHRSAEFAAPTARRIR